jgi:PhnB protein
MSYTRITPHVSFDGQCREAFLAYQQILGGKLATLMKYGESPLAAAVDAKWHERILHATLDLDGAEINGADWL